MAGAQATAAPTPSHGRRLDPPRSRLASRASQPATSTNAMTPDSRQLAAIAASRSADGNRHGGRSLATARTAATVATLASTMLRLAIQPTGSAAPLVAAKNAVASRAAGRSHPIVRYIASTSTSSTAYQARDVAW